MDIKGYNNLYEIDDKFNIYRKGYWIVQKNSHGVYKRYMKPKLIKQTIDKEGYYSVSYFIMELINGDVVMDKNDMFVDNVNLDNKKAFRSIFYHIQKLYEFSYEKINADEEKIEMVKKYKEFTENF